MPIPIKIECDCGQHYAFDVEPVNGRMPTSVACPACGVDGTPSANELISLHLTARPATSPIRMISPAPASTSPSNPPPTPALRPASPETTISIPARATVPRPPPPAPVTPSAPPVLPTTAPVATAASVTAARIAQINHVDPEQVKHEARAKILWGDSQDDVVRFLMMKGFPAGEATALAAEFFKERIATTRATGIRRILIGTGMLFVPLITLLVFLHLGVMSVTLLGVVGVIGLYGGWLMLNGILTAVAPKSEQGNASGDD